jgi:hypothetical protein
MKYWVTSIGLLVLLAGVMFTSGCTSVHLNDTHNTTVVLTQYNEWAIQQKTYTTQVRSDLVQMESHLHTYNQELTRDNPDIGLLRGNVALDGQILNQWGTGITTLDTATDQFAAETGALDLGNASDSSRATDLLVQNMKIYTITMKNAQQHFVEYNYDMNQYLTPDNPDYWDDALRQKALDAKSQGLSAVASGDRALTNITATAGLLQQYQ